MTLMYKNGLKNNIDTNFWNKNDVDEEISFYIDT